MSPPRVLWTAGSFKLAACRHGVFWFNTADTYIGRSLETYGEFSELEVALLQQMVVPGSVVVEAGANIGALTVPLARAAGPTGRVIAFEPQRVVHQTLCTNIALNGLTHVDCRRAGVGAAPGMIRVPNLAVDRPENFGGVSLNLDAGRGSVAEDTALEDTVPLETVDGLGLESCRLLKVDVEGMELDVLRGAERTLRELRPLVYVENDRREQSPALIEHLLRAGYRLFWHLPPLFQSANFSGEGENLFPGVVSVNMVGVPAEFTVDMRGFVEITDPGADWREGV
jgi:FkbM family methyltransferase